METNPPKLTAPWAAWKKIIFRFFFIYLAFQLAPWTWLSDVPGISFIINYYSKFMDWLTTLANDNLFHVRKVLVPENGSGDTSMGWANLWTLLLIALIGCIIWSALDSKRNNYNVLNYWLCLFTRYFIAMIAFAYGIEKMFLLQMIPPNMHQLATPLGDLLPMRFSWLFIGYSDHYQFFSGLMEFIAGLLLLYRRTVTLGVLVATGVFINIMMLNLCYDIPVKIFSMQLVFLCLFLLVNESKRLIDFFILNKQAIAGNLYHFALPKKWMRVTRIVFKVLFILIAVGLQTYNIVQYYSSAHKPVAKTPIRNGVYEVTNYTVNNIALLNTDTLRWQEVILENGTGSVKAGDTIFRHRYGRAYFGYKTDTIKHSFSFVKPGVSTAVLFTLQYTMPDTNTIQLKGKNGLNDVVVELKRTNRHFQLAEKQFHWLSEHNR